MIELLSFPTGGIDDRGYSVSVQSICHFSLKEITVERLFLTITTQPADKHMLLTLMRTPRSRTLPAAECACCSSGKPIPSPGRVEIRSAPVVRCTSMLD